MKETERLKKTINILRELGEDWRKNIIIINDVSRENETLLESIRRLSKKSNQSKIVKIGLTLIAFPLPIVIDDVLGGFLLAVGLIQRQIKNSALYIEDIDKTFPRLVRDLQEIRQEMVWP